VIRVGEVPAQIPGTPIHESPVITGDSVVLEPVRPVWASDGPCEVGSEQPRSPVESACSELPANRGRRPLDQALELMSDDLHAAGRSLWTPSSFASLRRRGHVGRHHDQA
jgi:hypothetical protein